MPFHEQWLNEYTIHHIFPPTWTIGEYRASLHRLAKMLRSTERTVHLVVDFSQVESIPPQMIITAKEVNAAVSKNTGGIVGINVPLPIILMTDMMHRFLPELVPRVQHAKTMAEAQDIIYALEQSVEV